MSTSTLGLFLRHLALSAEVRRLSTASDHDLLAVYEVERGQAAFTELIHRHGPMVLRACRRVLGHGPDAEDAFQATFVLLARKAGQLGRESAGQKSLGGWLHRIAYQMAMKVLRGSIRRKTHERQATVIKPSHRDPSTEAAWNEIEPILDAELGALPDEARGLLIAFYLEEKTYTEVAAELGLPRGSLVRRLEKARELLAARLARRGITVSASLLAVLLEESAKGAVVPAVLLVHTVEAARTFFGQATGIVSENVVRLVKGGLVQMTKSWTHWSMALAGWASLLGVGLIACQTLKAWPDQAPESAAPAAERPAQEAKKHARTDCFGDPLPPGVLARMGTARLFNGENHFGRSTLLAFSPDSKILASHTDGITVVLWDAATGKEIRRLTTNAGKGRIANSLGFSPDGKTVVAATCWGEVYQWDAATGKLLRAKDNQGSIKYAHRDRMAFLPDGRMLTVGNNYLKDREDEKGFRPLYVRDVATDKEVCHLNDLKKRYSEISATAFSLDGKLLATAVKHDISLWDVATGKEIHMIHSGGATAAVGIQTLAFSFDGKTLASADTQTVFVWDVVTGKELRQLEAPGHMWGVALAFSLDGKTIVGGREGHLWEVSTGKKIRSLGLESAKVALFSPDGKTLAVGDEEGVIRLLDMATGKEIFPHPGHRESIRAVAYSPDGKTLTSVSNDRTIRLWDAATGKELRQFAEHTDLSSEIIAYSPDGKLLASKESGIPHLWDAITGKEIRWFGGDPRANYLSMAFSSDGKLVAANTNQTVFLWEAATGKEVYRLTKKPELTKPMDERSEETLAFSPDGRMLAVFRLDAIFRLDNAVSLWEVATGKPVGQLSGRKPPGPQGDRAAIRFLAFSPDGRMLATSSSDSQDDKVHLWEVASGKEIRQLDGYKHRDGKKDTGWWDGCVLAFSPDGRMLATAVPGRNGRNGTDLAVTLWDVATGKEIGRLAGHRNVIQTLAFSPDGKTLASAGDDLTCLIWDIAAVAARPKPAAAGPLLPRLFSKDRLEAAWADLANTDTAKAYRAISALRAEPRQAILLLKERVRPVTPIADPKQLARWIADLEDERFAVREKAQRAIERLDEPAIPALRRALADQPPLEVKRRLQNILAAVEPKMVTGSPGQLRQIRAVQVLESIGTAEARQLLQALAKGIAGARLTVEAEGALARLTKRSAAKP